LRNIRDLVKFPLISLDSCLGCLIASFVFVSMFGFVYILLVLIYSWCQDDLYETDILVFTVSDNTTRAQGD
jgi:hypothetical protein